jgi:NitT/TauT family transport system substrate-binding protein
MEKFIIQPHYRLQEWIAQENGYFESEGLDCELIASPADDSRKPTDEITGKLKDVISGAFEMYKDGGGNKGVKSNVSCACHWAVNEASAQDIGRMWHESYAVTPGGVMVPPESAMVRPEDLAGREIAVSYHSGSHFSTIQALEPFISIEDINLKFVGTPWARVDIALARDLPAVSAWGITFQFLEQLGFRKIVDTSFIIGFMFPATVDPTDVGKYMNALKRAQMDLDLAPERYKRLYLKSIPERYQSMVDVRRFSTGERVVFLPYTKAMYLQTQAWLRSHQLFETQPPSSNAARSVPSI